ncbi:MAG TPA: response regulator [Myxococcales bacterium]|jgi:two-component system OmpR family response regulator|nr:response regulator [Myxococcales bacterium]
MRLLIVEDNQALAQSLSGAFRAKGYAVDCAAGGEDAEAALHTQPYDLLILDLGLPDMDGFDVLRRLRRQKSRIPVLVLTARDTLQQRVDGLNLGADDYLGKPFALEELEARAGALLRRGVGGAGAVLRHGRLALDTVGRMASLDGEPLELPRRELCLLELLLLRCGQVVGKQTLLDKLFSFDEEVGHNAVELYVHRLRKKLQPAGVRLRTVRGLGYLLENP